jgi:hypothetical protein
MMEDHAKKNSHLRNHLKPYFLVDAAPRKRISQRYTNRYRTRTHSIIGSLFAIQLWYQHSNVAESAQPQTTTQRTQTKHEIYHAILDAQWQPMVSTCKISQPHSSKRATTQPNGQLASAPGNTYLAMNRPLMAAIPHKLLSTTHGFVTGGKHSPRQVLKLPQTAQTSNLHEENTVIFQQLANLNG